MMKKITTALFATFAAFALQAQSKDVHSTVKPVRTWDPKAFAFSLGADISNSSNRYGLTLLQWKAQNKRPVGTTMRMLQRTNGFCGDLPFPIITVNGIKMQDLSIKPEHFTAWQEGNKAGCELKLNFSGVKMVLRLYMRPDSPALWGVLKKMPDSVTPVKKASFAIWATPSLIPRINGKIQWAGPENQREAVVNGKVLTTRVRAYKLTPADTLITLRDKKWDGSSSAFMKGRRDFYEKGMGPSAVILDYTGVKNANVAVRAEYNAAVNVELNKDFTEFHFGVYQLKNRISNADFAKDLVKNKKALTLVK